MSGADGAGGAPAGADAAVGEWAEAALRLGGADSPQAQSPKKGNDADHLSEEGGEAQQPSPLPPKVELKGDSIQQSVRDQLVYYFSPQNLQTDIWLKQHLDERMQMPIRVVAEFPKIQAMGASLETVIAAAKSISDFTITEGAQAGAGPLLSLNGLRPSARTTIVLRDIPTDVSEDELRQLFAPREPRSVRREIQNTVFCSFESEEVCKEAFFSLSSVTLRGEAVRGRIKSETSNVDFLAARYAADKGVKPDPLAEPWYPPGQQPGQHPPVPAWAQPPPTVPAWAMPPPTAQYPAASYGYSGYAPHGCEYDHPPMYGPPYGGKGMWRPAGRGGKAVKGKGDMPPYAGPGKGGARQPREGSVGRGKGKAVAPAQEPRKIWEPTEFPSLSGQVPEKDPYGRDGCVKWSREEIIGHINRFAPELEKRGPVDLAWPIPAPADCVAIADRPQYSLALTDEPGRSPERVPTMAERLKQQSRAPAGAAQARQQPRSSPASPPAAAPAVAARSPPAQPTSPPAPGPADPPPAEGVRTWAEAAVTARDVRAPQPAFKQYRAAAGGGTVIVPGGRPPADGQRSPQGKGKKGKGKGQRSREIHEKPVRQSPARGPAPAAAARTEPAPAPRPAESAEAKRAREQDDDRQPAPGSWAAVAMGLPRRDGGGGN
eukprot:TRINITY_DN1674_c8_g2_i1.p1 TRINITY_DN1674_c8_g2~~TRINITY_DN1674_c8_g2_i1.p1  ORF type:complete len:681 (+),score=154.45 TRINITY_DN1674_c8_g2_i1:67-2043(+)